MPIDSIWIYSAIIIWFSAGCVLSHYARKRMGAGVAEYFIANRRITALPSAMTYAATTYSAFMMVGLVGLTYALGSSTLGFELTYLIGTVMLLLCFAPRIWIAGKRYGFITPTEMLAKRFENVWVGVVGTIICAVMIIPYSSVQYMGIGYLVEELSGGSVPFIIGSLIVMFGVFVYAYWAGMRSVALTDILQGFIMIATSLFLLFYVVYNFFGSWEAYVNNVRSTIPDHLKVRWGFASYIGLTIPWFFFAISNPQVFQRCYIPNSVTTLKRMIWGFTIFGFIYTIICTQLGFMARLIIPELKVADRAMPILLTKVPDLVALITLVGILAAAISTLNSIILTLSSMCGRDIYRALKPDVSENKELFVGKALIPIFSIVCFFFALFRPGLIAILSAMSSGGMLMLVPTIFATFFWKRATAIGALSSMSVGALLVGIGYAFGINPFGYSMTIWGLIVATFLLITVSYMTKPPKIADEFISYVNEKIKEHNM
ncbi:MAG: sodium:solute symporter family protein [Nitrososphaerota archaeon]|nr:sodium:solute symporter family protein [Nitrososphaerales archaeon]MDW8044880.1 sodium:solute symporter family protein [Nitrososphaerota archaeon]